MPRGVEPASYHTPDNPPDPSLPVFTDASFLAFLGAPPKFTKDGQLLFQLVVPYEDVEAARPLYHLVRNPLPVEVHIQVYEPYARAHAADDARLLELIEGLGD